MSKGNKGNNTIGGTFGEILKSLITLLFKLCLTVLLFMGKLILSILGKLFEFIESKLQH